MTIVFYGYHQYERLSGEIHLPLILIFAECKHQYEQWGKLKKFHFFPSAHIDDCIEQTSI